MAYFPSPSLPLRGVWRSKTQGKALKLTWLTLKLRALLNPLGLLNNIRKGGLFKLQPPRNASLLVDLLAISRTSGLCDILEWGQKKADTLTVRIPTRTLSLSGFLQEHSHCQIPTGTLSLSGSLQEHSHCHSYRNTFTVRIPTGALSLSGLLQEHSHCQDSYRNTLTVRIPTQSFTSSSHICIIEELWKVLWTSSVTELKYLLLLFSWNWHHIWIWKSNCREGSDRCGMA